MYDPRGRDCERRDDDLWGEGFDKDGDGQAYPAFPSDSGGFPTLLPLPTWLLHLSRTARLMGELLGMVEIRCDLRRYRGYFGRLGSAASVSSPPSLIYNLFSS